MIIVVLFIFIVSQTASICAQDAILIGKIESKSGIKIKNAYVEFLVNGKTKIEKAAKSNSQGLFIIETSPGNHTLKIYKTEPAKPLINTQIQLSAGTNLFHFVEDSQPKQLLLPANKIILWGKSHKITDGLVSFDRQAVRLFRDMYVMEVKKKETSTLSLFLPRDLGFTLRNRLALLPTLEIKNFKITKEPVQQFDIKLPEGQTLALEATEITKNSPVSGLAMVLEMFIKTKGDRRIIYRSYSRAEKQPGKYTFDNLPPGRYRLRLVNPQGHYMCDDSTTYYNITVGSSTKELKLRLVKPTKTNGVKGKVRIGAKDTAGLPIVCSRSLELSMEGFPPPYQYKFSATSNKEGSFNISNLPAGRYSLAICIVNTSTWEIDHEISRGAPVWWVSRSGLKLKSGQVDVSNFTRIPEIKSFSRLTGKVVQGDNKPQAGANVLLVSGPKEDVILGETTYKIIARGHNRIVNAVGPEVIKRVCKEDGEFSISNLLPGEYELLVTETFDAKKKVVYGKTVKIKIEESPADKEIEIKLSKPSGEGHLILNLVDKWGNPASCVVPRFFALLVHEKSGDAFFAMVDASGQVVIENMPQGTYYVTIYDYSLFSPVLLDAKKGYSFTVNVGKGGKTEHIFKLPEN